MDDRPQATLSHKKDRPMQTYHADPERNFDTIGRICAVGAAFAFAQAWHAGRDDAFLFPLHFVGLVAAGLAIAVVMGFLASRDSLPGFLRHSWTIGVGVMVVSVLGLLAAIPVFSIDPASFFLGLGIGLSIATLICAGVATVLSDS